MKTKTVLGGALLFAATVCMAAEPFKIVSYNVRHCADIRGVLSPEATARTISKERARFVALQEMDVKAKRSKGVDQPAELARLTGLQASFARAIPLQGGSYGNALLSREKPLAVRKIPLPGKEPRVLLLAEFDDCCVGSMHLALEDDLRLASVPLVEKAVAEVAAKKPVFLCGDWNATPDSPALKALGKFMKVISTQKVNTFHGSNAKISAAERAKRGCMIDYVAVDRAHAAQVEVLETQVTEDRETSDHAPISVTLKLKQPKELK